jgi:hypothetical protein
MRRLQGHVRTLRAPRPRPCAARSLGVFPAHLLEIAAGSEGVKLCPSTSTATAGGRGGRVHGNARPWTAHSLWGCACS